MTITRHGLFIGFERIDNIFYLSLKAIGKLTHADYETITPLLDAALEGVKQPAIRALFDATELEGWELRAAWDDFKIGLKHGNEFEKIAIYGNQNWLALAAKLGAWFIAGEIKYFEGYADALAWLKQD